MDGSKLKHRLISCWGCKGGEGCKGGRAEGGSVKDDLN